MVGGQSGPKPTASLCPPSPPWRAAPLLPVHAWLSPLSSWQRWLCHPTPVARATPEPAARVTACAAAHAQLGMVPVVWPGRMGAAAMPRCCRVPQPVQQCMAHPVPWSHQRITDPSLLHPRCWLSPTPPSACQRCRHVASSWDCPLPVQATTAQTDGCPVACPSRWYVP